MTVDWYTENIEPGIRDAVRLLRSNGFNTTCSCGSHLLVEGETILDGELKRLHDLLYNNGYRDYCIEMTCEVMRGIVAKESFTVYIRDGGHEWGSSDD